MIAFKENASAKCKAESSDLESSARLEYPALENDNLFYPANCNITDFFYNTCLLNSSKKNVIPEIRRQDSEEKGALKVA